MRIETHGQQIEITPALRDYVETKLARLSRHFDRPLDVRTQLSIDKPDHRAEATITSITVNPSRAVMVICRAFTVMLRGCSICSFMTSRTVATPGTGIVSIWLASPETEIRFPATMRFAMDELPVSTSFGHTAELLAVITPAVTRFEELKAPTFKLLTLAKVVLELPPAGAVAVTVRLPSCRTPPGRV